MQASTSEGKEWGRRHSPSTSLPSSRKKKIGRRKRQKGRKVKVYREKLGVSEKIGNRARDGTGVKRFRKGASWGEEVDHKQRVCWENGEATRICNPNTREVKAQRPQVGG